MIGVEGCGGVGGDVLDCALPGLWAKKVIQLHFVSCGACVGANLCEILLSKGFQDHKRSLLKGKSCLKKAFKTTLETALHPCFKGCLSF